VRVARDLIVARRDITGLRAEPTSRRHRSPKACLPIRRVGGQASLDCLPNDGGDRKPTSARFGSKASHLVIGQRNLCSDHGGDVITFDSRDITLFLIGPS
jgi:hypothetical protein